VIDYLQTDNQFLKENLTKSGFSCPTINDVNWLSKCWILGQEILEDVGALFSPDTIFADTEISWHKSGIALIVERLFQYGKM